MDKNTEHIRKLIFVLFFASGISGLVYEVVWTRMLTLVFGNTVFAVSTVLTAFMAGLALGSFLFGRLIDRRGDALKVYGLLEGGIGIYCLLIPLLFLSLDDLYVFLYRRLHASLYVFSLVRFVVCFFILIVPTTLMGGTLPVITKFFVHRLERLGQGVGRLYSINTFGAVVGCFATGFFLIPLMGVRASIYTAAGINLLVALAVLSMVRGMKISVPRRPIHMVKSKAENGDRRILHAVLITIALSGFAALVYEVVWTRTMSLSLGISVYAFSTMLTTFLVGLALGSYIFSIIVDSRRNLLLWFGLVETSIGIMAILLIPAFDKLPLVYLKAYRSLGSSWGLLTFVNFFLYFSIMFVPTLLMGAAFPIASKLYTRSIGRLGHSIGSVYSVNTLGAIAGSFMGGFVFIPMIGLQNSILVAAFVNVAVGAYLILINPMLRIRARVAIPLFLFVAPAISPSVLPEWNKKALSTGMYYQVRSLRDTQEFERKQRKVELLYYREGISATVAVVREHDMTTMMVGGKPVASTGHDDMRIEHLLGHLPLLLHKNPKSALVIGLGTGVTYGSVGQHDVQRVDCVEIAPSVVEAAELFSEYNHNILDNPKANLIIGDGRNYVLATEKKYDVITSDPIHPWAAGAASLYSRNYYELCKNRLSPSGIMAQWLPLYEMSAEDLKVIINTFRAVFPHTTIWASYRDALMIGSSERLKIDFQDLKRRFAQEGIGGELKRFNIDTSSALLSSLMMAEEDVPGYVGDAQITTDDHPTLEFSAPKNLYLNSVADNLLSLNRYRKGVLSILTNLTPEDREEVDRYYRSTTYNILGYAYTLRNDMERAIAKYRTSLTINPHDRDAAHKLAQIHLGMGNDRSKQGQYDKAIAQYQLAVNLTPESSEAHNNLGLAYARKGLYDKAIAEYEAALKVSPDDAHTHNNLGLAYAGQGLYSKAIAEYEMALRIRPNLFQAYGNLGVAYLNLGRIRDAAEMFRKILEINPGDEKAKGYLQMLQKL